MSRTESVERRSAARYPIWIDAMKGVLLFAAPGMFVFYVAYLACDGFEVAGYAAVFWLVPVLSAVVRRTARGLAVYLAVHVMMLGWTLLAPDMRTALVGGLYVFLVTLYGAIRRVSRQEERDVSLLYMVIALGILFFLYLVAMAQSAEAMYPVLAAAAAVYAGMFLYYMHWIHVYNRVREIENVSWKRMRRYNEGMYAVYVGGIIVMCGALYFIVFEDVIRWLDNGIGEMVRGFMGYLAGIDGWYEEPWRNGGINGGMDAGNTTEGTMMFGWFDTTPGAFWIFLGKIVELLAIIGIVFLIIRSIYKVYKATARFRVKYEYANENYAETRVHLASVPGKERGRRYWFVRTPEEKVRREYYKKVKRYMGETVKPSETPKEVARTLPEVERIRHKYEEARYRE